MRLAFFAASSCCAWIARLVLGEFDIDASPVVDAEAEARSAILNLMPSKRRKLGPNDRCWCGSGLKLKKCHGV